MVVVERRDGVVLVCPVGELDLATAPALERVLEALMAEAPAVELDLSGLVFADCAGLRPVRRALHSASFTRLRISGARPHLRRVLELTGLQESPPVLR
jgi:anti-sigma B factor antagonist